VAVLFDIGYNSVLYLKLDEVIEHFLQIYFHSTTSPLILLVDWWSVSK